MALLFKKKIDKNMTIRAEHLIDEMLLLIKTVNSTLDEDEFEKCFVRLRAIFEELCLYEPYVDFTESPKKELRALKRKKNSAYKELLKRQQQIKNSTSSKMPRYDNSCCDNFDTDSEPKPSTITSIDAFDPLFADAGRFIIEKDKASIGMLQRVFKIGFNRATHIMDQLCEYGVVGEEIGTAPRKLLVDIEQFEILLCKIKCGYKPAIPPNEDNVSPVIRKTINIDSMNGHEFEEYCANLLECSGFINVIITQGSGDHGIDILADKDDISYAIQCKCYSSNIGNAAVQQALAGKKFYKKDIAVVLTNQYFTPQAKEEAVAFGVKLWDRDKLNKLIENAK